MEKKIDVITKFYLDGKTLEEFADGLGIGTSKQSVFQWKSGENKPSPMTLFQVISSPEAAGWAKAWAGECLAVLQQNLTKKTRRLVAVRNLDGEVFVDPEFAGRSI